MSMRADRAKTSTWKGKVSFAVYRSGRREPRSDSKVLDGRAILQLLSNRRIRMNGSDIGIVLQGLEDSRRAAGDAFENDSVGVRLNGSEMGVVGKSLRNR